MAKKTQKKIIPEPKATSFVDYYPAVLKKNKSEGYLVEFRYKDPISGEMKRGRHYVNKLISQHEKKSEGLQHARKLAFELTEKLKSGWTPVFESDDQRLYTPITKLRDYYLTDKKNDIRDATMTSYKSVTKIFNEWIEATNRKKKVTGNFKREDAVCYMDYIATKDVGNRTYNNTLKGIRAMFTWAVEHCYCKENPFIAIKPRRKENKRRILIDADSRAKIKNHLEANDPQFLLVCQLVYNSAMRPKEIANVKINDINLQGRYIRVTSDNAKNGKSRCATITQDVIDMLTPFMKLPGNYYLFGMNKQMLPSMQRVALSKFRKRWTDLREKLHLPNEMQLYSLRDTGMVDLLHAGVNELSVQQHYDHSSLKMQAIYTNHFDPNLNETIFRNAPKF